MDILKFKFVHFIYNNIPTTCFIRKNLFFYVSDERLASISDGAIAIRLPSDFDSSLFVTIIVASW